MFGFLLVMKAEMMRSFIIMRRYWFRTVIGLVMGYGMLMVLIAGFMYSKDSLTMDMNGDPDRATSFVLSFIIGVFAFGIIGMFTSGLQSMAGTGVLEQLCMSPHGLITNFLARTTVAATSTILSSGVLVWLVTWSMGGTLYWDTIPVLTLLVLTFVNLLGFGFMVGGLVLVFKQVGQIAVMLRMALFGIAVFAREEIFEQGALLATVLHAIPITDAAVCLKYVLVKGQGAVDGAPSSLFLHPSFYFLVLNCVVWTAVGIVCFKVMENYSRLKGTLGTY